MSAQRANRWFDITNVVLVTCLVLICLAPFIHILAISFSSNEPIMAGKVSLYPVDFTLEAYAKVFQNDSMIRSLGFTIVLTLLYTALCMLMTLAAAYPLSKNSLKGGRLFMFFIVVTMFFSGGLIPEYILVKDLHLMNSMWSLILPQLINPFYLIILISFIRSIPEGLEEAAQIDGCSPLQTLFRIILPLSMPIISTISLFYAVNRWNGFTDTLFYITKPGLYPLQLKLYQLIMNNMATDMMQAEGAQMLRMTPESLKAASVMFATLPILLVYPWLQRYFVSGIMVGAVKG
ncbi:carbohydrate ABC transporter permease [Paenibacillus sp. HWE-109]|uniref:carbohydrate ABC transporter permease n=1 Tax=Paenibacillus sp. HWE-109 TaxID=1306526 RepID=UPI001EDE8F64|nr:carbohydrate ABC transporter permease [Paenibacillus sp. HWE-109]UKS25093.1 carbohydrate ABC transporter permease [Paenibacillus sp. HWE-109]